MVKVIKMHEESRLPTREVVADGGIYNGPTEKRN